MPPNDLFVCVHWVVFTHYILMFRTHSNALYSQKHKFVNFLYFKLPEINTKYE